MTVTVDQALFDLRMRTYGEEIYCPVTNELAATKEQNILEDVVNDIKSIARVTAAKLIKKVKKVPEANPETIKTVVTRLQDIKRHVESTRKYYSSASRER